MHVGFAVGVGTRWGVLVGSFVMKGHVLVVTPAAAVVAVFILGVVLAGTASTVVVCM